MKLHGFSVFLAAALLALTPASVAQDAPAVPEPPADPAATPIAPRDISPPAPAESTEPSAPSAASEKPATPKKATTAGSLLKPKKKSPSTKPVPAPLPPGAGPDAVLITLKTKDAKESFVIKLRPDLAPKTVENFKKNVESGFYDGLAFHRLIRNYLIQTGDPLSKDDAQKEQWGTTDIGQQIPGEFGGTHGRYAVAMAHKAGETTSSGSQFYITLRPASNLDGSYAVFGEVIQGTEVLNRLSGAIVDTNDVPVKRIEIVEAKMIRSDAKLALDESSTGRRKTKSDAQKGRVEKFIERIW